MYCFAVPHQCIPVSLNRGSIIWSLGGAGPQVILGVVRTHSGYAHAHWGGGGSDGVGYLLLMHRPPSTIHPGISDLALLASTRSLAKPGHQVERSAVVWQRLDIG